MLAIDMTGRTSIAMLILALGAGCTSSSSSGTARTGTEQLLISNAVDQSLSHVDFRPLAGKGVYIEEKYLDCVDKGYVVGSVRHRALRAGARLVPKPENAEIIVELRSGVVGTDTSGSYLGIPEVVLPGLVTLPEIRLLSRDKQMGTAKIAMVAYDAKSMQVVGDGGVSLARSDDSNWYLFGVGPWQRGSIRTEVSESISSGNEARQDKLPTQVAFRSTANQAPDSIQLVTSEMETADAAAPPTANQVQLLPVEESSQGEESP